MTFEYFDSAVFLQAGSLSKIDLGADWPQITVCFGEITYRYKPPTTYSYKWYKDNTLITEVNPSYTVKDLGT
jgi:hypothetical protein